MSDDLSTVARDTLCIAHLNLQNSKAAGDEARQTLTEMNIDELLIQEPYSIAGQVKCFRLGNNYVLIGN